MQTVLEQILLEILKSLLTKEVMDSAKKHLIEYLKAAAADTSTSLDDAVVKALADFLGVPY